MPRAYHVADNDAASLVKVARGELYGGLLVVEEHVAQVVRQSELRQSLARVIGEVVRDLEVDVIGRE